jgi:uncharacterized protein HemY
MGSRDLGLLIIGAGVLLLLIGAVVLYGGSGWFGRLPGDVRIERGSTRVYLPITSMVLLSIVLSLLVTLLRRFL